MPCKTQANAFLVSRDDVVFLHTLKAAHPRGTLVETHLWRLKQEAIVTDERWLLFKHSRNREDKLITQSCCRQNPLSRLGTYFPICSLTVFCGIW